MAITRSLPGALLAISLALGAAAPAAAQDEASTMAGVMALVLVIVLVMVLTRTLLPIYVFFDAEKRNYNPVVWIIVVAMFGLIPFFIYLAMRPKHPLPKPAYYYYQWGPPAAYPAGYYAASAPYPAPYYSQPAAGLPGRSCRFCGVSVAPGDARCPNCGLRPG